jgi:hypothetical protein
MGTSTTSTVGADWTQLLSDPAVAPHFEALLKAYREAPPAMRDQALRDALHAIQKNLSDGAAAKGEPADQRPFPKPSPAEVPDFANAQEKARADDRRSNPRSKCFVAVELQVEGSPKPLWGNLSNTSMGGCFVETTAAVESGAKLEIGLWVADGKIWVKGIVLNGVVTTTKPCLGFRIKFKNLDPKERETLREFLKFVEKATQGYNDQHGYLAQMKR